MEANLVLTGGKIVTMDGEGTVAEAVAVKYGRIVRVGSVGDVTPLIGGGTRVVDLGERTVLPGFIDSHCHMISEGASRMLNVDLSEEAGVYSIGDLVARLRERADGTPAEGWVKGYQEDDSKLKERRHPTRWELDEVSGDHPVVISTVGGHFSIANSLAFELAGVTRETPDPEGGRFDRAPETGELTGGLHEKAIGLVVRGETTGPTREQSYEGARRILRECTEAGITCVYDTVGRSEIRAALDLKNTGELPVRVRMDVNIGLFPELNALGLYRGLGDDWLRLCGLKFFFDGAISARTAAVTEPYLNKPGFYGVMATTREVATKTIMDAYAEGYRVSAHANGDAAIVMFLDIMEEAQSKYPREDPRNRDIHCTVITPELVERIRRLGILPTIFGPYVYYHGDKLIPAFGEELLSGRQGQGHRAQRPPCAPFPPLMAIHGLVNRTTKAGKPIGRSQRVSVMEAIRLYTVNAAYQSFDEDRLGSIEEGKLADMVVLGGDILTVPTDEIMDIPVEMTIIDGEIVHEL